MPKNPANKPLPSRQPKIEVVQRPWGSFEQYAHNLEVTVSLMTVEADRRLSLQSHSHRSELWIILDAGAIVQVYDSIFYPQIGEKIWIPADAPHRLSCKSGSIRVLEVAYGNWQQEDIIRYEDDYARPAQGE